MWLIISPKQTIQWQTVKYTHNITKICTENSKNSSKSDCFTAPTSTTLTLQPHPNSIFIYNPSILLINYQGLTLSRIICTCELVISFKLFPPLILIDFLLLFFFFLLMDKIPGPFCGLLDLRLECWDICL